MSRSLRSPDCCRGAAHWGSRQRRPSRTHVPVRNCLPADGSASPSATAPPVSAATPSSRPRWELQTYQGLLVVRPVERGDVKAAGVVLTRAFASSAEAVALSQVLKDIDSLLQLGDDDRDDDQPPPPQQQQSIFLVARIYPTDPQNTSLPPGQGSRLIGTASISFSADSQPVRVLPPVNLPPRDGAYLSNMAVDPSFRRQGVARALLAACEDAARGAGRREVWLHVREADAPARALYDKAGYVAAVTDSWMDTLRHNMRPRVLMRRVL